MKKLICLLLGSCLILSACSSPPKYGNNIIHTIDDSSNQSIEEITPTTVEEITPTEEVIENQDTNTDENITPTEEPIEENTVETLTEEVLTSMIEERVIAEAKEVFPNTVKLLDFKVVDTDSKIGQAILNDNEEIENGLLRDDIFNDWNEESLTKLQTKLDDYFGGVKIEEFVNGKPMKIVLYSILIPEKWGITEGINAGVSSYDGEYTTKFSLEVDPISTEYIHVIDEPAYRYYSLAKEFGGCNYLPYSYDWQYLSVVFNQENHYRVKHGYFITLKENVEPKDILFSINVSMKGYYILPEGTHCDSSALTEDNKEAIYIDAYSHKLSCSLADIQTTSIDWNDSSNNWIENIEQPNGKHLSKRILIEQIDKKPILFTLAYTDLINSTTSGENMYIQKPQFTITAFMLDESKTIGKTIKSINIRLKDEANPSEFIDNVYFGYASTHYTEYSQSYDIKQCKKDLYTLETGLVLESRPVEMNDYLAPQEENFTDNLMNDLDLYEIYVIDSNGNEIVIPFSWVLH